MGLYRTGSAIHNGRLRRAIVYTIGGIGLIAAVALAWLLVHGLVTVSSVSDVSRLTSLRFPRSARLAKVEFTGGFRDSCMFAVIACDPEEVPSFLSRLPKSSIITSRYRAGVTDYAIGNPKEEDWWHPDSVKRFTAAETRASSHSGYVRMLIDLDDSKRSLIYLIWMG